MTGREELSVSLNRRLLTAAWLFGALAVTSLFWGGRASFVISTVSSAAATVAADFLQDQNKKNRQRNFVRGGAQR